MKLKLSAILLSLIMLLLSVEHASAALINIDRAGEMRWNVLGAINFTQIASNTVNSAISEIVIKKDGNNYAMDVGSGSTTKTVDLSEYEEEIVEIEKETDPERVTILASGESFLIRQRGIDATTSYPIKISETSDNIVIETNTGDRFLVVLPHEAVLQIVRANIVSDVANNGQVEIIELPEGELAYKIDGEKTFSIFKFFDVPVSISAYVSALTGNVLEVDQPTWSRVLSFLLI